MDTDEERDELTGDDEPILGESMDDEPTYRDRAAAKLDQIARDAKEALIEHGIGISLFFLIPNNGDSILLFGTTQSLSATDHPSSSRPDRDRPGGLARFRATRGGQP